MNKIAVALILTIGVGVGSTAISYADGVVIPMSIKVEKFKKEMKHHGINLYGGDEADGYIQNDGNKIKVITYKPVTMEQLELIKQAAFKTVRR